MNDKILEDILNKISKEYDLPLTTIEKIFNSQWEFIRTTIEKLPLSVVNESVFNTLKTNFNIPALGKLFTNYKRIENVRKKSKSNKEKGYITKTTFQ